MAHTLLFTLGYNAPEDRILPEGFDWSDSDGLDAGLQEDDRRAARLDDRFPRRAERRAPSRDPGSHDKTGRHCLPNDPNGKLDIVKHAGFWLRDDKGNLTRNFKHICWDGCMFPNAVMTEQQTWNDVLGGDGRGARCARVGLATQMKRSQHRAGRLRLHGAHALECVPAGAALFRSAAYGRC